MPIRGAFFRELIYKPTLENVHLTSRLWLLIGRRTLKNNSYECDLRTHLEQADLTGFTG